MIEIKLKRLTLFLMEILFLQKRRYITKEFSLEINDFIYMKYNENKELFSLIFDTRLLEEFIRNNYEIITPSIILKLISPYKNIESYATLVEEVGYEVDQAINFLVLKFLNYYDTLFLLKYTKPITKILQ